MGTDTTFIYRYDVDDDWHRFTLTGPIVHVGSRHTALVEMWVHADTTLEQTRWLRVFGTGQPLPAGVVYVGSTIVPNGSLVWHLFERPTDGA